MTSEVERSSEQLEVAERRTSSRSMRLIVAVLFSVGSRA